MENKSKPTAILTLAKLSASRLVGRGSGASDDSSWNQGSADFLERVEFAEGNTEGC